MSDLDPIVFLRSIDGSTAKVVLAFLFTQGGMTLDEMQVRTGLDPKTLTKSVRLLSSGMYGMLASQPGPHNRLTWVPAGGLFPALRASYFGIPDREILPICDDETPALPDPDREILPNCAPLTGSQAQPPAPVREILPNWQAKTAPDRENLRICAGSIRLIDDDPDPSKKTHHRSEPAGLPKLAQLLEAMVVLRGKVNHSAYAWESLSSFDLPVATTPAEFVAWLVKVWRDRERLTNPEGLLRLRLVQRSRRSLPEDWRDRLPVEYLEACGLAVWDDETASPGDDEQEAATDEAPATTEDGQVARYWQAISALLEADMPRLSFQDHVATAAPVDYLDGRLTVAARGAYDRDWLESRLGSTITRLMVGICNHPAPEICFVVRAGG